MALSDLGFNQDLKIAIHLNMEFPEGVCGESGFFSACTQFGSLYCFTRLQLQDILRNTPFIFQKFRQQCPFRLMS